MSRRKITDILFLFCLFLSVYGAKPVFASDPKDPQVEQAEYARQLKEVAQLAQIGAAGLALHKMDLVQPNIRANPPLWIEWETLRLKYYQDHQNWHGLIKRVAKHPVTLPPEFVRQAQTQAAAAHLQLTQGKQARLSLRRLILSMAGEGQDNRAAWIQKWRRMIIQGYIAEGLNEDAQTAILRFQQDYTENRKEILILQARVLLLNKRPAEAAEILARYVKEPQAKVLYLLAQLRSEEKSPAEILKASLSELRNKKLDRQLRPAIWALVAEAALGTGNRATVTNAVEHVLADTALRNNKLFEINADSLWNAYIEYALSEGNKSRLLIGQDGAWFKAAARSGKKHPIRQRAFYALLMQRGSDEESRSKAASLFIKAMRKRRNNHNLIQQLFSHSQFYSTLTDVPESVRRSMVDLALARQDIPQASQIMATLDEPPKSNKSGYMWHLQRARILIMGGKPEEGVRALSRFTRDYPKVDRKQIDQFLQVVFDLQTIGKHDSAYDLFRDVINITKDQRLHRELYYWMADSRSAQAKYHQAAELYLKSASLLDGKGWDPWGQTARYQAAKALGKAGLYEDAYYIYQRLLKVTKEADRRAVLRYEIQKLQLTRQDDVEAEAQNGVEPGR